MLLIKKKYVTLVVYTGQKIPLNVVDVFWRQLDFKPSKIEDDEVDVEEVLRDVIDVCKNKPTAVKKVCWRRSDQ